MSGKLLMMNSRYKNSFEKLEVILLVSTAVSLLIFSLFGLDLFRLMTTILTISLSIFYFGFSIYIFSDDKGYFVWYSILIGVIYSTALIGICFWVNNFSGYNPLLLISSILLLFIFFPLTFHKSRKETTNSKVHRLRSVLIGISALTIYLLDFF